MKIQTGTRGAWRNVEYVARSRAVVIKEGEKTSHLRFTSTTDMIDFALAILGACPAMELAQHPKARKFAAMILTAKEEEIQSDPQTASGEGQHIGPASPGANPL